MSDEIVSASIASVLRASGLDYDVMPCDPELADTAVFCEHYGYPPEDSVNTIIVKAKTGGERFVACALLAHTRLDVNGCVRKRIASRRVSFASAEETERMTGMTIGGVTPTRVACRSAALGGCAPHGAKRDHSRRRQRATRRSAIPPDHLRVRIPGVEVVAGLAIEVGK